MSGKNLSERLDENLEIIDDGLKRLELFANTNRCLIQSLVRHLGWSDSAVVAFTKDAKAAVEEMTKEANDDNGNN